MALVQGNAEERGAEPGPAVPASGAAAVISKSLVSEFKMG